MPMKMRHLVAETGEIDMLALHRTHESDLRAPQVLCQDLPFPGGQFVDAIHMTRIVDGATGTTVALIAHQVEGAAVELAHPIKALAHDALRQAERTIDATTELVPGIHAHILRRWLAYNQPACTRY